MFSKDEKDLARTLAEMEYFARQKSNWNQVEAKQKIVEYVTQDRRFDGFDANRLAERVQLSRSNGASLSLDDPQLKKGGQPRPLDRWR